MKIAEILMSQDVDKIMELQDENARLRSLNKELVEALEQVMESEVQAEGKGDYLVSDYIPCVVSNLAAAAFAKARAQS